MHKELTELATSQQLKGIFLKKIIINNQVIIKQISLLIYLGHQVARGFEGELTPFKPFDYLGNSIDLRR